MNAENKIDRINSTHNCPSMSKAWHHRTLRTVSSKTHILMSGLKRCGSANTLRPTNRATLEPKWPDPMMVTRWGDDDDDDNDCPGAASAAAAGPASTSRPRRGSRTAVARTLRRSLNDGPMGIHFVVDDDGRPLLAGLGGARSSMACVAASC